MSLTKTALIFGGLGQDGALLSEFLISRKYKVFASTRGNSKHINNAVNTIKLNPTSFKEVKDIINKLQPDEIYNLSGQTSVGKSFGEPKETIESFIYPNINILESVRVVSPESKIFFASSGEIFGELDYPANEDTPKNPVSPYGVAKSISQDLISEYRERYNLFCCSGILFGHESSNRDESFVIPKIIHNAILISKGHKRKLTLGNVEIQRDWGLANDFIEAMHKMLLANQPKDYIIATGETNSLRSLIEYVFNFFNLNPSEHLKIDKKLFRKTDILKSYADPSLIYSDLGWKAKFKMKKMLNFLIESQVRKLESSRKI